MEKLFFLKFAANFNEKFVQSLEGVAKCQMIKLVVFLNVSNIRARIRVTLYFHDLIQDSSVIVVFFSLLVFSLFNSVLMIRINLVLYGLIFIRQVYATVVDIRKYNRGLFIHLMNYIAWK